MDRHPRPRRAAGRLRHPDGRHAYFALADDSGSSIYPVEVLPAGPATVEWLDFDTSGHRLLTVENGALYRRSHGGEAVLLAPRVLAGDW